MTPVTGWSAAFSVLVNPKPQPGGRVTAVEVQICAVKVHITEGNILESRESDSPCGQGKKLRGHSWPEVTQTQ